MDADLQNLNKLIDAFLEGELSAALFEKEYTLIYDFTDFEEDPMSYIVQVREALERYTNDKKDLKKNPEYYISDIQLKEIIKAITRS